MAVNVTEKNKTLNEIIDWRDKAATLAIAAPREKCTD